MVDVRILLKNSKIISGQLYFDDFKETLKDIDYALKENISGTLEIFNSTYEGDDLNNSQCIKMTSLIDVREIAAFSYYKAEEKSIKIQQEVESN